MRVLSPAELEQDPQQYDEIAQTLEEDGIVCFPTASSYRIATSLLSENAVINFLQVKRRTRKAPTLIFVPDQEALATIVDPIPAAALALMDAYWPGPLTMRFALREDLPRKVLRNLDAKKGAGVRIPEHPIALEIARRFGGPLLISSANLERKKGAHSEAQVRKNFGRWIDFLVSDGDLSGQGQSTVIDMTRQPPSIKRAGRIDGDEILKVWEEANNPSEAESDDNPSASALQATG